MEQLPDLCVDRFIGQGELVFEIRIGRNIGVVNQLTNGFCGAAHIAPADMQPAFTQHADPADAFEAGEGKPDREPLQGLKQSAAERSPDESCPEPTRESDHDEGKEEGADEELIERGTVVGGEEEVVEAMDVACKYAEDEEKEVDSSEDVIDVPSNPGGESSRGA